MKKRKSKSSKKFLYRDNTVGYIFASPFIIGFLGFTVIPIIASLYYSFTDYNLIQKEQLVGLMNYVRLFNDPRFLKSVRVTLQYVFLSVPLKLAFALFIALLLVKKKKRCEFFIDLCFMCHL